jgi:hypothetical protein
MPNTPSRGDGWLHPIEIKLTAQSTRKQTLGLQGSRKAHPDQRIGHGLMLCAVEQPRWISEDVLALPWNLLWSNQTSRSAFDFLKSIGSLQILFFGIAVLYALVNGGWLLLLRFAQAVVQFMQGL